MYLGIDIGGTKTLVATLDAHGVIRDSRKFPTNHDYTVFLQELANNIGQLDTEGVTYACAGIPGLLNREEGIVYALGNLPWQNKPIRDDIAALTNVPTSIENDSRLAGLSEAQLIKDQYDNILFITVSTGIGGAFIQNGRIAHALRDTEMGKMPLQYDGATVSWEEFASGRAIFEHYQQRAADITDPAIWHEIALKIAQGLGPVCATLQPEAIIIGGSVGEHADKFKESIHTFLAAHLHPVIRQPKAIFAAQRASEAVIYGCYDLAKQTLHDDKQSTV